MASDRETTDSPAPEEKKKSLAARATSRAVDGILDRVIGKLDDKDRLAAAKRVAKQRKKNPEATPEELARLMIRRKCRRTAVVGAVTAAPAAIPGLGTLTSLVLGSTVDLALTAGLQAELVLEIACCYGVEMTASEERSVILMVTGVGVGANQLIEKAGRQIAAKASEQLAKKSVARSVPLIGMGAAAGTNTVTTYAIGRRAISYFALGEERMESWAEALRAVTGVDERKLVGWMSEAGEGARDLVGSGLRGTRDQVITVARSTGDLVVTGATKAGSALRKAGGAIAGGAASVRRFFGKKSGEDTPSPGDEPEPLPLPGEASEKNLDS